MTKAEVIETFLENYEGELSKEEINEIYNEVYCDQS